MHATHVGRAWHEIRALPALLPLRAPTYLPSGRCSTGRVNRFAFDASWKVEQRTKHLPTDMPEFGRSSWHYLLSTHRVPN